MRFLFSRLKPFVGRMSLGLAIKISGTMVELFLPLILSHILNVVIQTLDIAQIVFYGCVMILCATAACVCNIIANRMAAHVSMEVSRALRRELFDKTLRLSARDTDRFTIPSLESRITSDTYNVHSFLNVMQRMGVRAPILLVGGMILSFLMDPFLALVMLAMLPFIFIIVYCISRKGTPLYTTVQKSVDNMVRVVREDTQGIRVIKALSKNEYENSRYDTVNKALSQNERRAGRVTGIVNPVMTLMMNLGIATVVALSAVRVANNTSSPATVIAFMQYFTLISMALMSISRIFIMYTKCAASASRIAEVVETPQRFYVESNLPVRDHDPHIVFENVSFSYFGKRNNINNVSFSLPRGSSLGIIGATGSGKTTLLKLLLRFYDIDSGNIRINGKSITAYTHEELTALFGIAQQNDFLYADTIEENIRFGREMDFESVQHAAKIAQAHDFIMETADGYQHLLAQKGTNLSGGQRQRLLIARALAGSPEILILDDSSSALDYKTDANLRKALREALRESTFITVAQRISSVKDCDLILVMEDGNIIGQGTHEELMLSCAEYREISDSQMGGAFVE